MRHRVVYADREVFEELGSISLSTLARRLREMPSPKARMVPRPRAWSPIKSKVPIGRYDWDEARPGALEADVVEHNGGITSGQYVCTLSVTDVVTGWSRRRAVMGRGQAGIHEALSLILDQWPYPCWGLHADNGSEFLAGHVQRFVAQRKLEQTRSRPYKKNDSAHIEQRNRFVREMVGYERYDTPEELLWLNKVYELMDPYANLVLPTMKLVGKKRSGSKVRKTYDIPRPPLDRAIDHGVISRADQARLESMAAEINPLELHRELERLINRGPEMARGHLKAATGAR
jgi:transposase InsO family protein